MALIIRKLRLGSGLIMLAFLTSHLINLALALVSVEFADAATPYLMGIWFNPVGGLLVLLAALTHMALALVSILMRRTLSMTRTEALQFLSGFLIPPLLVFHLVMVTYGTDLAGVDLDYHAVIVVLWSFPIYGLLQVLGLVVAWSHGAMGLLTWLRLYPVWPRISLLVNFAVILIPISALFGFLAAEREITEQQATNPDRVAESWEKLHAMGQVLPDMVVARDAVFMVLGGLFVAAIAARLALFLRRQRDVAEIRYPGFKPMQTGIGTVLLDVSRAHGIPHAAICGGRGRCATCRVRIIEGEGVLAPPSALEADVLTGLSAPQNVRLACQALVKQPGTIEVERLLPAYANSGDSMTRKRKARKVAPLETEAAE